MPSMALAASSVVPIVTNANPRARPVSRSVTRWTSLTVPNCWKAVRTPSAVVLNERFPTYRRGFISLLEPGPTRDVPAPEGAAVLKSGFQNSCPLSTGDSQTRTCEQPADRRTSGGCKVTGGCSEKPPETGPGQQVSIDSHGYARADPKSEEHTSEL